MGTREIEWDDLGDILAIGYFASGIWPVGVTCETIETLNQKKSVIEPRKAWIMRPLLAAAKKAQAWVDFGDKHEKLAISSVVVATLGGLGAGITAGCTAWSAFGASWGAMLTLKGLGLGLGAIGIGAAVAPVVATAASAIGLVMLPLTFICARGWKDIKQEYLAGREETRQWKKEQEDAQNGRKPHPLIAAAEARHVDLDTHGTHERAVLFHRLRSKFPAEFDEAVRRTDHDTVLRNNVPVLKQIRLKTAVQKKQGAA